MDGLLGSADRLDLVAMFVLGASTTVALGLAWIGVGIAEVSAVLATLHPAAYIVLAAAVLGLGAIAARRAAGP